MQFPHGTNRYKLKNRRISTIRTHTPTCAHGNCMRNCWLTAIAGHQANAPSNISHEGPTGAEGTGGTTGPGRGARGYRGLAGFETAHRSKLAARTARGPPTAQPGPTAGPGTQKPRVHKQQPSPHSDTQCPIPSARSPARPSRPRGSLQSGGSHRAFPVPSQALASHVAQNSPPTRTTPVTQPHVTRGRSKGVECATQQIGITGTRCDRAL